ncbi:glycosyltransferase family 4 protein [Maritimibacter dapengensis]|uniref:Glycosyltransferase family 4 protein n=1 Tax=Maritimibacter dapengensis TaxID=2836868 RepID=A0ABS6T0Q6_9RHOB|nr:glycosyltransferase family 4 protein [Maritimibacter dapengensis]MBV7377957.1 glycosyltransferase family 4 protein [Maritimibacter dapengensis]
MRDTILLCGGFELDRNGASALRALSIAKLYERIGYRVVVLGKFDTAPGTRANGGHERLLQGVTCRDIRQPCPGRTPRFYPVSAEAIDDVARTTGTHRVRAIQFYNYPARGLVAGLHLCRRIGAAPILDCTEWPRWEGRRFRRNLYRRAGIETRMRALTRVAGNVICASDWFRGRLPRQHTIRLPFVLDTARPEWMKAPLPTRFDAPARFIYSGSPGVGMAKDRLPLIIDALDSLASENLAFQCDILGITRDEYLRDAPQHRRAIERLAGEVRFHGRVSHATSLDMLRRADFSVFFRKPDRVAHTGFATKFVEAHTLGIPVVTNATSDIPRYLTDGKNGFLAPGIAPDQIAGALRDAVTLSPTGRQEMRRVCLAQNAFEMDLWQRDASRFLDGLRGLA